MTSLQLWAMLNQVEILEAGTAVGKTHTVLYVEDLENNRMLVRRILESRNYRVVEAVNGLEGIAKAIEIKPDIILMDINLPDLDGFSVVTRIRSEAALASTPIIAVTARNVEDDAERAKAIGCDSYLSKPFGVADLLQQVETHLSKPREKEDISRTEQYLREHSASLVEELERKFNELSTAHKELSVMHERLQRLDEAKTDFINVAAHELRTPLTMVHAYTDMLRTHPKLSGDETIGEMMDGLRKGVDRLNDIIQDMVSIVRVELSTMELAYSPMPLRLIMQSVVKSVTPALKKRNQTISVNIPDSLPMIVGDDKKLVQLFSRLIGNAIKYTPDSGKIAVAASYFEEKAQQTEDRFVQITVSDTGIGIDKKDQGLIFEKFYTAEDASLHSTGKTQFRGGGPGLGLTIAKGIVEAHRGRIWVESDGYDPENNPGSVFYVLLPAYEPPE